MFSIERNSLTRFIIYGLAVLILGASLFYSNYLAERLAEKETASVQLFADAINLVGNLPLEPENAVNEFTNFITGNILHLENNEIPLILVGEKGNTDHRNLALGNDSSRHAAEIQSYIREFQSQNEPIKVEFAPGRFQTVLYGDSFILEQLRWFPFIQLLVAFVFIGVVFFGFAIAKRNEQNQVWVGLAKETAHQLGTPVSSLMAWVELMKIRMAERPEDNELINEMERDILRLENIAERFSKIGSQPELTEVSVEGMLDRSANYIKKRMTQGGRITLDVHNELPPNSTFQVNPHLFEWVVENVLKNALDAIQGKKGKIHLRAKEKGNYIVIEISDTGKGIAKSHFKKVFEPGFTTKKRGWGLGLSLTKRIVENYHKGKIFVKSSEIGKGTTFRILLPKRN